MIQEEEVKFSDKIPSPVNPYPHKVWFVETVRSTKYFVQEQSEKPGYYQYQVYYFVPNTNPQQMRDVGTYVYEIPEGRRKLTARLNVHHEQLIQLLVDELAERVTQKMTQSAS